MRLRMAALLAALSLAALLAGGCASNEVVKTEGPGTATVKPEATIPVQQPSAKEAASTVPVEKAAPAAPVAAMQADQGSSAASAVKPAESAGLETVYFDYDKSDLRQDSRNVLSKNADVLLKAKNGMKIRIEGHCDERGSAEYNLALGERRAKSVQQYLLTLGVQADRLSTISYGKEKPAVQGSTEEAWAKNRRAEFVLDK